MIRTRWVSFAAICALSALLAGCGGGGGDSNNAFQPGGSQTITTQSQSNTIHDIQARPGWTWCSQKRNGGVCAAGLGVAETSMTQNQSDPSLGGDSSVFWLGGPTRYSNALWWNGLNVDGSPSHFTYDVFFFIDHADAPEALEFDVNQSFGGVRYTWGTECSFKNTGKWDIWDPKNERWVTTSVPCNQVSSNAWHHLVWQFERVNGQVHYIGLQLDNQTATVDKYFGPQQNWNMTETDVAFQMDGNFEQAAYKVWLDHLNLTSW